MDSIKNKQNSFIFLVVAGAGLLATWGYWIFSGNAISVFDWIVLGEGADWELADFYRHIGYGADLSQTYWTSVDACFPPLTYLFFHVLYLINPQVGAAEAAADWRLIAQAPYSILIYIFYVAVFAALWIYVIWDMFHDKMKRAWIILPVILFFSFPFFCALERGNPVFVTGLLILAALNLAESDDKRKREIALVFFAIAVCMKIYPAIFGFYYLKRKRYGELIRLIIWSACLFFIPFIFTGGIEGLKQFINIEFFGHYDVNFMREISSVRGLSLVVGARIGLGDTAAGLMGQVLENVFLIASIVGVYLSKDRWSEVFFLTAICSFYMPTSWVYSTLYLSAGALFFLKDRFTEQKVTDKLFAALFGAIFTVPIWFYFVGENPGTWVCLMAYLLWAITFIRCIVNVMALKTHNGQIR